LCICCSPGRMGFEENNYKMNREVLKEKALEDLEGTLFEVKNMLKPGTSSRDTITNMLGRLKMLEDKEKLYEILKHSYTQEGKSQKELSGQILEFYVTSLNRIRGSFLDILNDIKEDELE